MVISYVLTLVVAGGMLLIAALLLLLSWRARNPRNLVPEDLPVDPGLYGPLQTNQWLRALRMLFVVACVGVLAFHGYWVFGAPGSADYNSVAVRDLRNRRVAEAGLRGWVFDRTGKPDRALVRYRLDGRDIVRYYPLGEAAVQVTGYSDFIYGSAGVERAYTDHLTEPASALNALYSTAPVGKDLKTTIDMDLQRRAHELLKGKRGAAVVIAVPSGEVLAMASSPRFDPARVDEEDRGKALNVQSQEAPEISPLTDRALKT